MPEMPELNVPSPIRRDKEAVNTQGEGLGWEHRWSEAQLHLFRDDLQAAIAQAGCAVRDRNESDPGGFFGDEQGKVGEAPLDDGGRILIVFSARRPNNSDVVIYALGDDGAIKEQVGNHDMTASEFIGNLKYVAETHHFALPEGFGQSEECARLRDWTKYEDLEV